MKLILDLDSLVERARLLIFALMSLMDHTFCHTRSMILFSFPFLVLSSLRPDDRSSEHTFYFSAYLLVSRCASRGNDLGLQVGEHVPQIGVGRRRGGSRGHGLLCWGSQGSGGGKRIGQEAAMQVSQVLELWLGQTFEAGVGG